MLVVLGVACSGEGLTESGPRAERSFGLLSVSYIHNWDADHGADNGAELATTAQFVRYSALDRDQVARLLALPLDPRRDLPTAGKCKLYDLSLDLGQEGVIEEDAESNVELLEAGNLRIETSEHQVTLKPKHYPGLLPFISGVVYGEAQSDRAGHPGRVTVAGDGGEAVGAFRLEAQSPLLPQLTEVAGVSPQRRPRMRRGEQLVIGWRLPGTAGNSLYIEIRPIGSERDVVLRCLPESNETHFTVPAERLVELGQKVLGTTGSTRLAVELSHIRREYFDASGLQQGELRLKSTDSATVQIQ